MLRLYVEVARVKGLQEDDALPPTTSVQLLLPPLPELRAPRLFETPTVATTFTPIYNCGNEFTFEHSPSNLPKLDVGVVVRYHRQSGLGDAVAESHWFAKATVPIAPVGAKGDVAASLYRAREDIPITAPSTAAAQTVLLRYRVSGTRVRKEYVDHHPDAQVPQYPALHGGVALIPSDVHYAWVNVLRDRPWKEKFAAALLESWLPRPPLSRIYAAHANTSSSVSNQPSSSRFSVTSPPGTGEKGRNGAEGTAGGSGGGNWRRAPSSHGATQWKTLAELIRQGWGCRRSHEVLTKLRLSAKYFIENRPSLHFSTAEEATWKAEWRTRGVLLRDLILTACREKLYSTPEKEAMEKLYLSFVMGVPYASQSPLSTEMRVQLERNRPPLHHQVALRAHMLRHYAWGLSLEECESIAQEDFDTRHQTPLVATQKASASPKHGSMERLPADLDPFNEEGPAELTENALEPQEKKNSFPADGGQRTASAAHVAEISRLEADDVRSPHEARSRTPLSTAQGEGEAAVETPFLQFVYYFTSFVGRIVETLTMTEFLHVAEHFSSSVLAAYEKLNAGTNLSPQQETLGTSASRGRSGGTRAANKPAPTSGAPSSRLQMSR